MIEIEKLENGLIKARLNLGEYDVTLFNFGARTGALKWKGADKTLYYSNPESYLNDPYYMGAFIGRIAGRIQNASLSFNGTPYHFEPNEGNNLLHGGHHGLSQKFWEIEQLNDSLLLCYESKEGEGGFFGDLTCEMRVSITEHGLSYDVTASSNKDTLLSLAQHNYYKGDFRSNALQFDIGDNNQNFLLNDALIVTGEMRSVSSDLREFSNGIDDIFTYPESGSVIVTNNAQASKMTFRSNQPLMVIYDGSGLKSEFLPYSGFCLEPQNYLTSDKLADFPHPILKANETHFYKLAVEFKEI